MKYFFIFFLISNASYSFAQEFYVLADAECVDAHKVNNKGSMKVRILSEIGGSVKPGEQNLTLIIDNSKRMIIENTILPSKELLNKSKKTDFVLQANTGVTNYKATVIISSSNDQERPNIKLKKVTASSDYSDESAPMPENYNPSYVCK